MSDVNAAAQKMVDALPEKTGRGLDEWMTLLEPRRADKHGQIVSHLKAEHGVTHGYANLIAHYLRSGADRSDGGHDDLVASQYAGPKADLRPIYDAIVRRVRDFGDEAELAPKKAYVSLRRKKQFGLVQPSTRTRVDVGIQLPGLASTPRLEASGSFNAMVSHRVRLDSVEAVDDELVDWLRQAYERAG